MGHPLDVTIKIDEKLLYSNSFKTTDYFLDEAKFEYYLDLAISPLIASLDKADRFALSTFLTTTKVICEKYKDSQNEA
jgi:hypothetical protein